MKKTWIGLCLTAALCMPLAGCAGDKTGGEITPSDNVTPSTQATVSPTPDGEGTGANAGTGAAEGTSDENGTGVEDATNGTVRSMGRSNDSALERVGEGIQDTLDDMGSGARRMAQDAKRAME